MLSSMNNKSSFSNAMNAESAATRAYVFDARPIGPAFFEVLYDVVLMIGFT